MKATIVPIGNSKGIRIPKTILKQCHIEKNIDLEIEGDKIIIKPIKKELRKNWDQAFQKMKENKDDRLIIDGKIDLNMVDWEW